MAEAAAAETPKKKGGKLPMIIALVVTLGAGGYFGMKMGGGSKEPEKPKVELGEITPVGEYLVNLADGKTYLRVEVSLQLAKDAHLAEGGGGGEGHGGAAEPPAPVKDAIVSVLSSKTLAQVATPEGKAALKKEIAAAVNATAPHNDEEEKDSKSEKKGAKADKKGAKGEAKGHHDEEEDHGEEEIIDKSWDSQKGPVLKVFFTSFATQQ
ncbi:MAG: flagellar basal body-associated FliL family protein [Fimbriimonadaceae bacterium]|nr:flagellar basal body-associated FliL family protein [Fimbriimonadaceae bacterium]QYK55603.1 MAG: flagellar basal body-associated FliL family protein [Fimbriimonadaceae bacterium]